MSQVNVPMKAKGDKVSVPKAKRSESKDETVLYLSVALLLSIAVPYLYYSIQVNTYAQANQPDGFKFPKLSDFWRAAIGTFVCQTLNELSAKFITPLMKPIVKGQEDEVLRNKYAHKASKGLSRLIQYTVLCLWGYKVLNDSKYLPWFMGGTYSGIDAFENSMINNPFNEFPRELYEWFLYATGMYFGELLRHVWDERKPDFTEMLIHHMATVLLVFVCIYANVIGTGAIISVIHMSSDIFVALCRLTSSTKHDIFAFVCFLGLLSTWFYFRLMCLPFWIYCLSTNPMTSYPDRISEFNVFWTFSVLYLLVLQILHFYWFGLFLMMLRSFLKTGVAEDTQSKVKTN